MIHVWTKTETATTLQILLPMGTQAKPAMPMRERMLQAQMTALSRTMDRSSQLKNQTAKMASRFSLVRVKACMYVQSEASGSRKDTAPDDRPFAEIYWYRWRITGCDCKTKNDELVGLVEFPSSGHLTLIR